MTQDDVLEAMAAADELRLVAGEAHRAMSEGRWQAAGEAVELCCELYEDLKAAFGRVRAFRLESDGEAAA